MNKYKLPNDNNIYILYEGMYQTGIDVLEFANKLVKDNAYNIYYEFQYHLIIPEIQTMLDMHRNNKMLQLVTYGMILALNESTSVEILEKLSICIKYQ